MGDITKDAIQEIADLARKAEGLHVDIDNRAYSARDLKPVIFEPRPAALDVTTLAGFVAYIKANRDSIDMKTAIAIVDGIGEVSLATDLWGDKNERSYLIRARVDPGLKVYPFEKYMEIEAFVIAMRSMFEPTEDREKLIRYVSKVRGGSAFSLDDDGVSQTAQVTTGVSGALTKKETAPAIVQLRPYRTFRDIDQVESEFLFRMKLVDSEEKIVGCALFEADGGRWRNQAIKAIRSYLQAALPEGEPAVIA